MKDQSGQRSTTQTWSQCSEWWPAENSLLERGPRERNRDNGSEMDSGEAASVDGCRTLVNVKDAPPTPTKTLNLYRLRKNRSWWRCLLPREMKGVFVRDEKSRHWVRLRIRVRRDGYTFTLGTPAKGKFQERSPRRNDIRDRDRYPVEFQVAGREEDSGRAFGGGWCRGNLILRIWPGLVARACRPSSWKSWSSAGQLPSPDRPPAIFDLSIDRRRNRGNTDPLLPIRREAFPWLQYP